MISKQKITPNLWFDKQAEEAAIFYTTIFKTAELGKRTYYSEEGFEIHQMPAGSVMTIEFELEGQKFIGLNGGPIFKFTEAISFVIDCETQEEIDYYWERLNEGGDPKSQQCGWLKDKFGVSWQVVPSILSELLANSDPKKASKVMHVMLQMKKLDLAQLKAAAEQ